MSSDWVSIDNETDRLIWVSIDNETDRLIKESREDDRVAEARQRQEYVKEELAAGRNPSTRAEEQMERDMDDLR